MCFSYLLIAYLNQNQSLSRFDSSLSQSLSRFLSPSLRLSVSPSPSPSPSISELPSIVPSHLASAQTFQGTDAASQYQSCRQPQQQPPPMPSHTKPQALHAITSNLSQISTLCRLWRYRKATLSTDQASPVICNAAGSLIGLGITSQNRLRVYRLVLETTYAGPSASRPLVIDPCEDSRTGHGRVRVRDCHPYQYQYQRQRSQPQL